METLIDRLKGALAGRYTIERELGRGGMATVYLAQDVKHDREVALKVLRSELAAVLGAERFLQEIHISARLDHPHILTLIDSGESEGFLWYVLPYVRGESLRDKLTREKQVPIEEAVRIATHVASALDYAHRQGVIHRDIKPENILLHEGEAVVADFGIALALREAAGQRLTESGLSLGTPQYMSPEQATGGRELDARSDVYSLAAVVYEMLAGEPPHTGPTVQAVIAKLMTERPTPIRTVRDTVPAGIDTAVAKALAKVPADRFGGAAEFAAALVEPGSGPTAAADATHGSAAVVRRRLRLAGAVVGCLAVVGVTAWFVIGRGRFPKAASIGAARSIAVLPLVNIGTDSTQEYFADGMTEELANALGKVPGLRVAARTSSYAFKGRRDLDVRDVGDKLGVAVVLQGSVRRAGNRVRVNVQLTDAAKRLELWSQAYDEEMKDVFAVQDSITHAIVTQLALTMTGGQLAAARAGRTANPEAHDLYLRGMAVNFQATEEAVRRSLGYFRQALEKDTGYAQAYAGIAVAYIGLADFYMPSALAYDSARIAARSALARDSLLGEPLALAAFSSLALDWTFEASGREMRRGLELDPTSSFARVLYSFTLCSVGRIPEGESVAERAIVLDRLNPLAYWEREGCLYAGRRYDQLIAQHGDVIALDPRFLLWDSFAGAAYREKGRMSEALAEYRRAQKVYGEQPLFGYAITLARAGRTSEAREMLRRLVAWGSGHYVNPLTVAAVYASLGEKDEAFRWLDRAVVDRTVFVLTLVTSPEYDPLRQDPRFGQLLWRIGLPSR